MPSKQSSDDIKPCSCCEFNGWEIRTNTAQFRGVDCSNAGHMVKCEKCGNCTCWWHTKQEAIDAWNCRPIEDALREEIKELNGIIEQTTGGAQ